MSSVRNFSASAIAGGLYAVINLTRVLFVQFAVFEKKRENVTSIEYSIRRAVMGYFDNPENVETYISMAEGYDGQELIEILKTWLEPGATVLELGMGPGVDLDILSEQYRVTGSDYSEVFLERYRQKEPDADLVLLNAVTLDINRKFDCIYSNKVLHHLTSDDLKTSLHRQAELLNDNGILFHSFWYGDKEEDMHGLHFSYYTEETLSRLIGDEYKTLELRKYTEMEDADSLCLALRKKK